MVILNPLLLESPGLANDRYSRDVFAVLDAQRLYRETRQHGRLAWLWRWIGRRSQRLLELAAIEATCRIHSRHYRGVQTVLIKQIQGSEGRGADFDVEFYPRQEHSRARWISIATAWQLGHTLPPVKLVQVEDRYFVLDGHHRISVARALGQEYIEGEVTVWQVSGPLPWSCCQALCQAAAG